MNLFLSKERRLNRYVEYTTHQTGVFQGEELKPVERKVRKILVVLEAEKIRSL